MKDKLIFAAIAVLSVALAALCGYFFCVGTEIAGMNVGMLAVVYVFSLLLSIVFNDLIHEGGHLLVGAILRMGVQMPRIRLLTSSSVAVNPKGVKGLKGRMIATTLAGLFFNLLLVLLGVIALCVPSVPVAFAVLMPYAFYTLCVNAYPSTNRRGKTDGLVAWELMSGQPTAQVMLAILKVQGMLNCGTRLEDVDESLLFDVPQLPEDDLNFIILTQLRYEYYLARGKDGEAYKYFSRYKQLIRYLPEE